MKGYFGIPVTGSMLCHGKPSEAGLHTWYVGELQQNIH